MSNKERSATVTSASAMSKSSSTSCRSLPSGTQKSGCRRKSAAERRGVNSAANDRKAAALYVGDASRRRNSSKHLSTMLVRHDRSVRDRSDWRYSRSRG